MLQKTLHSSAARLQRAGRVLLHPGEPTLIRIAQCRLWVEYVKKSRSEASRLHVQGNTWYKGFMGSMTAATTRLVHVDCLSGRFTPMRISLTLHCAPSDRIDDNLCQGTWKNSSRPGNASSACQKECVSGMQSV